MPMTPEQQEELTRVGPAVNTLVDEYLLGDPLAGFTPTAKTLILAYAQADFIMAVNIANGLSPKAAREQTKDTMEKVIAFAMRWIETKETP